MADVQVTCINKPDRNNSHESITHLGGPNWRWTTRQVIDSIKGGSNTFYTQVNGKRANIEVRRNAYGTEYLQTHADRQWNNNLLALSECLVR